MEKLTMRSKIAVRFTTDPRCLGYATSQREREAAMASYLSAAPQMITTPRGVLRFMAENKRKSGLETTYHRYDCVRCSTGETVSLDEIYDLVNKSDSDLEWAQEQRRR